MEIAENLRVEMTLKIRRGIYLQNAKQLACRLNFSEKSSSIN